MTTDQEWEIDRRRAWDAIFDRAEELETEHPDWQPDQVADFIYFHLTPDLESRHENV